MIYLDEADYDAPEYDICGDAPVVVILKANGVCIPLGIDCLQELKDELKDYDSKVHCYQCKHYMISSSGLRYGGSCKLEAMDKGIELTTSNAGYDCSRACNAYCSRGEKAIE